ncbi:hypothetical protein BO71DRAFT_37285 [Aspergillus ellipticus CBS 707.79]|uniref:Uncharacterized protein n=1 Tax=Aspergillus ellipticus CBS 707.79 TaxID=1448320 RepID=A0A319ELS2_9EURO|nr:hypothetical protein BO71DRAFT_37285 [Aspergillus ellipticus CBS 707.79]
MMDGGAGGEANIRPVSVHTQYSVHSTQYTVPVSTAYLTLYGIARPPWKKTRSQEQFVVSIDAQVETRKQGCAAVAGRGRGKRIGEVRRQEGNPRNPIRCHGLQVRYRRHSVQHLRTYTPASTTPSRSATGSHLHGSAPVPPIPLAHPTFVALCTYSSLPRPSLRAPSTARLSMPLASPSPLQWNNQARRLIPRGNVVSRPGALPLFRRSLECHGSRPLYSRGIACTGGWTILSALG